MIVEPEGDLVARGRSVRNKSALPIWTPKAPHRGDERSEESTELRQRQFGRKAELDARRITGILPVSEGADDSRNSQAPHHVVDRAGSGQRRYRRYRVLDQTRPGQACGPATYQDFFTVLDKAIFLTRHNVD